jgi:TIR domain
MGRLVQKKKVGTLEERFLLAIEKLQARPGEIVSDRTLREHLGWNDGWYQGTKDSLKASGKIVVAPGYGGPVRLPINATKAKKVFVSYSHIDAEIHQRLVLHLQPLCRRGLIEIWHDQLIQPGDEWENEIWSKFDAADIILLLISADFINSEFCYQKELGRALERHNNKEAVIIPVIARNCLWGDLPFGKIQALPDKGRPIMSHTNIDDVLTDVAKGLQKILAVDPKE